MLKVAKILGENSNVKIEERFQEALFEKIHAVDKYFKTKTVELLVNEQQDYQLWTQNLDGNLIDKVGNLPFKNKVFSLPNSSDPGYIEDDSNNILSIEGDEVIFKERVKRIRKTRSSITPIKNDSQKWIIGPADSQNFFRIFHSVTRKVLTSSSPDSVKIEELANLKDNTDKKQLTKVSQNPLWSFLNKSLQYLDFNTPVKFKLSKKFLTFFRLNNQTFYRQPCSLQFCAQ